MAIEIVDFPINSMVIFHSYVKLPEGKWCLKYQMYNIYIYVYDVYLYLYLYLYIYIYYVYIYMYVSGWWF